MTGSPDLRFLRDSRERFGRPQIIGHRGGRTYAPENTLAAFTACLDHGGEACELDARLTADDELVVMHDPTVDRTTGAAGRVANLALAQVTALRVAGEPVPSLREVFEGLASRGAFQVHVKLEEDEDRNERLLAKVAAMVAEYGHESRSTILATQPRTLDLLRHCPSLRLDIEIGPGPVAEWLTRLGRGFLAEGRHRLKTSDFDLASDRMARDAHREGLPLVCWASDSSDANVERLLALGVDAVMTDYPERMGALIDRLEATYR